MATDGNRPPIIQIVGYKNSGKTTLAARLIERLAAKGFRVGAVKRDAHGFEPDVPDTDSWKLRKAGASMTAISSPARTAWFEERGAGLDELLTRMSGMDVIIAEGFKQERYDKLALLRTVDDLPLLEALEGIIGVVAGDEASLREASARQGAPAFARDETDRIVDCVLRRLSRLAENDNVR